MCCSSGREQGRAPGLDEVATHKSAGGKPGIDVLAHGGEHGPPGPGGGAADSGGLQPVIDLLALVGTLDTGALGVGGFPGLGTPGDAGEETQVVLVIGIDNAAIRGSGAGAGDLDGFRAGERFERAAPLVAAAALTESVVAHSVTDRAERNPFGIELDVLRRFVRVLVGSLASSPRVEVDHGGDISIVQHLVDGVTIVGGIEKGNLDPPLGVKP